MGFNWTPNMVLLTTLGCVTIFLILQQNKYIRDISESLRSLSKILDRLQETQLTTRSDIALLTKDVVELRKDTKCSN